MKLIAFCASALMMLSGLAHAGGAPAPGPASAVSTLTIYCDKRILRCF